MLDQLPSTLDVFLDGSALHGLSTLTKLGDPHCNQQCTIETIILTTY